MINTFDDLKKCALKNSEIHLYTKESDSYNKFDKDSLKAYDYMIQYLADRDISFKIHKCINYANVKYKDYDYKIEFVLSEYEEECEKLNSDLSNYICEIVYISDKDEIRTNVDSFIENMDWQNKVKDEFKEIYPDYHINFCGNIKKGYKNLFDTKYVKIYRDKKYINVFVPHDIVQDEVDKIYKEMKPFLKKHKINRIQFLKTRTDKILEDIVNNEDLINNYYSIKKNKDIIWEKDYDLKDNMKYKYNKKEEKYEKNKLYFIYELIKMPYYTFIGIVVFITVISFALICVIDMKRKKQPPF